MSAIEAQNTPHHTRAAKNAVLSSRVIAAVNSSSRTKLAQSYKPLGRLRQRADATLLSQRAALRTNRAAVRIEDQRETVRSGRPGHGSGSPRVEHRRTRAERAGRARRDRRRRLDGTLHAAAAGRSDGTVVAVVDRELASAAALGVGAAYVDLKTALAGHVVDVVHVCTARRPRSDR